MCSYIIQEYNSKKKSNFFFLDLSFNRDIILILGFISIKINNTLTNKKV